MANIRIYDLAKKIDVSCKDIITELNKMNISGKTHASSIPDNIAEKIERIVKPRSGKNQRTQVEKITEKEKPVPVKANAKPLIKTSKDQRQKKAVVEEVEENGLNIPNKLTKSTEPTKVEKIKSKLSMQRAFQSIRKVEHKKSYEPKFGQKGGKFRDYSKTSSQKIVSTAPRKKVIKLQEGTTVKEFSEIIGQKTPEVIKRFMELGYMPTINQAIDMDVAILVAEAFKIKVEAGTIEEAEIDERPEDESLLESRHPVITVMGHVDHGKTSLLDMVRKTKVAESEAGGITQHIGAYKVRLKDREIVFLDTPGHEAFTSMRARGAKVTDIVVLVVAADDGVKPQTVEAINHATAAEVPIVVAINKIDKPEADIERVRNELAEYNIISEEWGGKNIFVEVSAKQGIGIDELLEMILLQADVMDLKANHNRLAKGVIIESRLDKGRGAVATVLIQTGSLKVGDYFISGQSYGKVRIFTNDLGARIKSAGPSTPVEVTGFSEVPQAGETFVSVEDEKKARQVALLRKEKEKALNVTQLKKLNLEELHEKIKEGELKALNIIVKADVNGSVEAFKKSLEEIKYEKVKLKIIHTSVGGINESDVMLASASDAIIIGFNVRADSKAMKAAEKEGIDVRYYNVIYNAINDVKKALEGMLEPTYKEKVIGIAEVRKPFSISRIGTIAGSYVKEGIIKRSSDGIRVVRDNIVVFDGKIASIKRFKEDVKEALSGYECGVLVENFNDIKSGDILENYIIEKVAAKL